MDEQDVDVNELGELILQFSETVNDVISVLNEPMDIEESSVGVLAECEKQESDSDDDDMKKRKKK